MAALLLTPRYLIQHSRFTKQDGWRLRDISLMLNGTIAVTGYNVDTKRTYIDVYTFVRRSNSGDKQKIIYSKEFEKYENEGGWKYWHRLVSFYPGSDTTILSALGDKLETIDFIQDRVTKSCKIKLVNDSCIECLCVRETEIFVSFLHSNKVTVYDLIDLNEIKSIFLQGIQYDYWPYDMKVISDRIFVCKRRESEESNDKLLIFEEKDGRILSKLSKPTDTAQWYAWGLELNITLNVIAVAWSQTFEGESKGKDVIVFYSLSSENNCSFLIVEVEIGVYRIRISDKGDRMITGNKLTQEWKVYDMAELCRYGHFKKHLQQQLQHDDCVRLTDIFTLPDGQRNEIFKSDTPSEKLILALEGKSVIQPSNVDRLAEAFTELGIESSCSHLVEFYQKTRCTATPYERFLATLSAHLTSSSPADMCKYFDIPYEKTDSIIYSPNPGLSFLLALDESGIITPSKVGALEQPFSDLRLVQAEATIREYQSLLEEETQVQQQNTLTEEGKKELFIKCLQKRIKSWYETTTPVPWKKSCRWKATDLFVGSSLVLTDSKAKRSLTDIDEECKLQYNQILNHKRLKTEKRIILEGEPGSGKTMMSSQVAYDWAQGKISEVDALIFLPLKFVNNISLVQAIKIFYFSTCDIISLNDIENFLANEDLQSCLILDGFEEYNIAEVTPAGEPSEVTKVMDRSKFSNCKVILTSRSDYAKDLPTCSMLRIGRFGEKEQHKYIEKVFADNTEKQRKIERAIENNPFILDLCSVPLLFVLAVHNIESIVMLEEEGLDRVAPFMENMVKALRTLPESKSEGSMSDSEGVSDESLLEEFAFNGLCEGQQILSWQRGALEARMANLKQFLDSGILVAEEGIAKENVRIIQDEKPLNKFSQNKKKTKKAKLEATSVDQMNPSAQVSTGAIGSSFYQEHSASQGANKDATNISKMSVLHATEEHISRRKPSLKGFTPKVFTKERILQNEGIGNKTGSSVRTQALASYEKVHQADRDPPTREYSVNLPSASGSVQENSESQSEPELRKSQKISNSSAAKDFPLEVKFLHKVIQEWFASKHFSSLLWKIEDDTFFNVFSYEVLPQISPIDLHYILRFTTYLCPPICYVIMDFLSQNHRTVNGVIPENIMNCICLCFAECKQENFPHMTNLSKAVMKESMNLVVAKLCREVIIFRSDDSRITQQSKVTMLKYAVSVGILIKEVHLVDVVLEVDETSTTLNSGVKFDTFNMIEVLEMSRWDQHLEQKDYQSIVKLVLCSNSIKKARLHFPSQPPVVDKDALVDLIIYDKTVEWIIGPKLIQTLNMESFKWEVNAQATDAHATAFKQISTAEVVAQVQMDCEAEEPKELTIRVGDIITNITVTKHGWWEGDVNGKRGEFPCNFVKVLILNPSKPASRTRGVNSQVGIGLIHTDESTLKKAKLRAKVIACYEPQEDDELFLEINEQIEVTNRLHQWWWEGIAKGKKGMFPSNFVMLQPEEEDTEQHNDETSVEAQVKYDYNAVEPNELTLRTGDTITDISVVDDGWWKGIVNGKEGMFPSNFVNVCTSKIVLATVVFSHTPQSDDELFLVEDDIIQITSHLDPLWWEGIVNGKQGYFPPYCVAPIQEDGEWSRQQDSVTPVKARVVYDYDAVEPDELTIKIGDTITDIHFGVGGWWEGVVNEKKGRFPSSFVEILTGTSEYFTKNKIVLAKATCNHTPQSNDELSLAEGDIVKITNRPCPGCWEGVLNRKKGRFPLHCVVLLREEKEEKTKQQGYETPDEEVDVKTSLHKEQFVDEHGGILFLSEADVSLHVPAGALKDGRVLHVTVPLDPRVFFRGHKVLPRITPLIICEPDNLHFHVPVKLTLPHCAVLTKSRNHTVEVKFGHKVNEIAKEMTWSPEPVAYSLSKHYCTVFLNHFSGIDVIIGSVEEKIIRVIPYTKLGQNRKHVLNVWLCNDLESDFQNVMQSEGKNESIPLDSYDTFRLRCVSGLEDKLNIRLDVLEGSSWQLDECETKIIKVKKLLISTKSKCNFRLVSDGDDGKSFMYFQLRVTQTVGEEETKTTFALRKRICDLMMPVKFTRPSSQNKQIGHLLSTDTKASSRPFTAVVYADPVTTFNDDIIITLWLLPFDSATEMFQGLQEEQELQYRHQIDTENSFSIVDEKPDIVTKTHFLNGPWHLSPEEMKIETDRLRFGSRAKFQFIGKRDKSNESKYIELQVETFQVGEETIRFMADVELNKLLYERRQKDIEKLKAYAIEEDSRSSYEDSSYIPFESETKLLPSTRPAVFDKEPSQSKYGADGNIQQRKIDVGSIAPEEQLRRYFMFLKKNLAGDWKDLGRCLKLITEDELTRLGKENRDDIEESIYQMLLRWQRKNGALATPESLIDALNEICRKDLADKLVTL